MITKNKITVKRFAPKLNIKKGDQVMVISGDEKGKKGEVQKVLKESLKAIVTDVNLVKRHTKPTNNNPGGIREIGKSVRVAKKSGQTIK